MTKELDEEKNTICVNGYAYTSVKNRVLDLDYNIKDLQCLETINNTNEALKLIDSIRNYSHSLTMVKYLSMNTDLDAIKEYILKAQEQEKENEKLKDQVKYLTEVGTEFKKLLKIIFEKEISIFQLRCCNNVDEYNYLKFRDNEKLTPEEFNIVKRYSNESKTKD